MLHSSPWRLVTFASLSLVIFAAVNVFWNYLGTGQWVDFSPPAYQHDLAAPLGETLLHPLSVLQQPWLIPVIGLLLAAAMTTPILMAVMYPLPLAMAFAATVAALGHAPIFAAALAVGCVVAARTPLRSDAPFLAVLLGLLPGGIYLYLFGLGDSQIVQVLPLQRWVLVVPMLIAFVAAVLAAAGVLAVAKLMRFRAGAIFPVLSLLLAGPIAIFYSTIGPMELDYQLATQGLAAGDLVFQPVRLDKRLAGEDVRGLNPQTAEIRLRDDLHERQQERIAACDRFLSRYERSSRAAGVLWLRCQCQSLDLDVPALRAGTVRYSAAFPSAASAASWQQLVDRYARSPQAALAHGKLGQLDLRSLKVASAEEHLRMAEQALSRYLGRRREPSEGAVEAIEFRPEPAIPSRGYYEEELFKVRRLLWLIERNGVARDAAAAEALAAMLNENPLQDDYFHRLGKLVGFYEQTALGDNLKVQAAMALDDPYGQADMLMLLAGDEVTDGAIEANYQLGMLTMQTARARALPLLPGLKAPEDYFRVVIAAPPSPWQELAREHLARLAQTAEAPATAPAP